MIAGGRVIDPDTSYDAVANVGLIDGRVGAITEVELAGKTVIDATGLVVAPGFIDLLSYEPNPYGVWYKIGDGVTTNLCMHGVNDTAEHFFEVFGSEAQRPPVHYGGAFDNPWMRTYKAQIPTKPATAAQLSMLVDLLREGIEAGWIGLDFEPEYSPWVESDEYTALSRVAAEYGIPVFSHIRYSTPNPPEKGSLKAIDELIDIARTTGAAVHVEHITSMATHVMDDAIAKIDDARRSGLDVTACIYPYDFWATTLGSERFAPGWQERFGISYGDLEVGGTGERLTEQTFNRYRSENKLVAAYAIPEQDVETALRVPWIMIGSDAIPEPGNNNHPRASGCFSRVLGRYVREKNVLSLRDALAKMTILPARRLEARAPAMRTKGRIQIGADADITVFDPETVVDNSTVAEPAQMSTGIEYVFVGGNLVKDREGIDKDVRPGQPIKYSAA